MNKIEALQREADRRRQDFAASLGKLRRHVTPLGLANEAMKRVDPQAQALNAIGRSIGRNPLPAIPVLLGLGWLFMNVRRAPAKSKRQTPRITSQKKENHHEDD